MLKTISIGLHIITLSLICILFLDYHFVDPTLYEAVRSAEQREIFSLAVQLGRLDFLNSVLAILAVVFGVGALFGIMEVRKNAEDKAEVAARRVIDDRLPTLVKQEVQRLLPPMVGREMMEIREVNADLGDDPTSDDEIEKMLKNLDGNDNGDGHGK